MSVGSVGGGSADEAFAIRRKQLEEDRARELERIEKRHREEIDRASGVRENAIKGIYDHQNSEIDDERHRADQRVARAKAEADERIRSFEDDSRRMSDEAKRQFETKASQLAKTANELEQQRTYLLKQHTDTMTRLKTEREQARAENERKMDREQAEVYRQKEASRQEMELKANAELEDLQAELRSKSFRTQAEGEQQIKAAQATRDETLSRIQGEIAFAERTGSAQLEHERVVREGARQQRQSEFEEAMSQLKRETNRDLLHAQMHGRENVDKAKEQFNTQIDEIRKANLKRTREMQVQNIAQQSHLENEAKLQDDILIQNLRERRRRLTEENRTLVEGHAERNERLREKLNEDYKEKARALADDRDKMVQAQEKRINNELRYQKIKGQNQLDALAQANAVKLAEHATRQQDPFYKLHDLDARFSQTPDEYFIEIAVPEHEQDTVRVTAQHDSLVVSGSRRAETNVESDDGGKLTTNSFQSYSQSFPITGKPLMNGLTREYVDGHIRIRIPRA